MARARILVIGILIILAFTAEAASLSGFAWSENIGWLKFRGPQYGVQIDNATGQFHGFAWSENIGWVKFDPAGPYPAAPNYGAWLDANDNKIKGWARICSGASTGCVGEATIFTGGWDGWVRLTGSSGGADWGVAQTGNPVSGCSLEGYAWAGEAVGWIKFGGQNYQVGLDQCVIPATAPPAQNLACSFNAAPSRLIAPQRSSRLTWSCVDADTCRISGLGSVAAGGSRVVPPRQTTIYTLDCGNASGQTVSISRTVTVIRSIICETIPFFPGCP